MYFRKTEKQELTIAEHKYAENIAEYRLSDEGRRFLFKDGFTCHRDFRHFYLLSGTPFIYVPFRHCPQAGSLFPTFVLQDFV